MIDDPEVDQDTNAKRKLDESMDVSGGETDADKKQALIDTATLQLKKRLCLHKFRNLNGVRMECMANLSEQFYLESGFNYLNFNKFLLSVNGCSANGEIVEDEIVDLKGLKITEQTNQVGFFNFIFME